MTKPTPTLSEQFERNVAFAKRLGVYDEATYPSMLPVEAIEPFIKLGAALVIAKTVQGIGLMNGVHGQGSLTTNYGKLAEDANSNDPLKACGIREWGGIHFAKTTRLDPVHDRGVVTPFHVALVIGGFAHGERSLPILSQATIADHMAFANSFEQPIGLNQECLMSTITASQYLTLNAMRNMQGLDPLQGVTRLPHYPVHGANYSQQLPTLSNSGSVVNMGSQSDIRSEYVGIRVVIDLPYGTRHDDSSKQSVI